MTRPVVFTGDIFRLQPRGGITRYFAELDARPEAVEGLRELVGRRRAVLLFAAADPVHNNAVALRDYLLGRR